MSKPIFNLFVGQGMTDRWWRLSADERSDKRKKLLECQVEAGGQYFALCIASWWNQAYSFWGVEMFPDFESWRQYSAAREQLEWFSYSRGWSVLGTWSPELDPAQAALPQPGKVYQAFLYGGETEAYHQLAQAEKDALWAKETETRQDVKTILMADSYWSTEEWQGFGVLMYPGIDSLQRHFDGLKQIGWPRYIRSKTLLGTLLSPDVEGMLHNFALLEMIGRPRWMRDNPPLSASMLWDQ